MHDYIMPREGPRGKKNIRISMYFICINISMATTIELASSDQKKGNKNEMKGKVTPIWRKTEFLLEFFL